MNRGFEPHVSHWRTFTDEELAAELRSLPYGAVILVDGRSGSGKSTAAGRIARVLGATVVHTDDIAWHHDFFEWADLLRDNILDPWRTGAEVVFRPPAWEERGRGGSIDVPAGARALVVEGVGCARPGLAEYGDLILWVTSDADEAYRRSMIRDRAERPTPGDAEAFWDEWEAVEGPFLDRTRPWELAAWIIDGTPPTSEDGLRIGIVGPPS